MNIAVFIKSTTFHRGHGGLETQNRVLCEGLSRRGHKITVFCPKKDVKLDSVVENGVLYVFVPCIFRTLFSEFSKNHWYRVSVSEFRKYNEKEKFDLVISQSSAGISIIRHKEDLGVKVLTISHGSAMSELITRLRSVGGIKSFIMLIPDVGYSLYNFFIKQRTFILNSSKVIAVSNFVKKCLLEETYAPENHIFVIHNGVGFGEEREVVRESAGNRLLYVGRIDKSKGLDELVSMCRDGRFASIRVDVVGDGDYLSTLTKLVKKSKLAKKILLHGKISYDRILDLYNQGGIFVFPTKRVEGLPMTLVEAMFCGLPIVAYNMGGVPDVVYDNETGFLVEGGNFEIFKSKVLRLVNDNSLYRFMSDASYKKAHAEFTVNVMLNRYEKVMKGLIR